MSYGPPCQLNVEVSKPFKLHFGKKILIFIQPNHKHISIDLAMSRLRKATNRLLKHHENEFDDKEFYDEQGGYNRFNIDTIFIVKLKCFF